MRPDTVRLKVLVALNTVVLAGSMVALPRRSLYIVPGVDPVGAFHTNVTLLTVDTVNLALGTLGGGLGPLTTMGLPYPSYPS